MSVSNDFFIGRQFTLTGCDYSTVQVTDRWNDSRLRNADGMSFTLDDVTYTAYEDDNDGYRSACEDVYVSDVRLTNTFPGVVVVGREYKNEGRYHHSTDNIIELIDIQNGKTVIRFGTEDSDDYYPSCVLEFDPTAMSTNT
jgi:hypothetical protein